MIIDYLMSDVSDDVYFSPEYITMIESHLDYLRIYNPKYVNISSLQSYKYEGDLYGLLQEMRYEKKFHYVIARVNGYKNSNDYNGEVFNLLIPNLSEVIRLAGLLETQTI